jgi:hypothetical protein
MALLHNGGLITHRNSTDSGPTTVLRFIPNI